MARTRAASQRTKAELARVARMFKVASSTTAVAILFTLGGGERRSGELAEGSPGRRGTVAKTLGWLRLVGLIASRRDGKRVFYSLTPLGRAVVALAELAMMWK
jgi:DNA-binding transcriptional ArsR family regulator